jgi:hypothetical protein
MNRSRAKRILGMNLIQWLVLGGLLLCGCLIAAGGYWGLMQMAASANAIPGVTPDTPRPPATPTETPIPTITPTPTPITYESLIPAGWKRFRSESIPLIEIWLPSSYARQTEADQKKAIPILQGKSEAGIHTILLLKDTTASPYLFLTTLEVTNRSLRPEGLDATINADLGELKREGRLLEQRDFEFAVQSYPARRLLYDINVGSVNAGLAVYAVQVGGDLWYLGFATAFNELYVRLPDFDRAVQTFRLGP